MVNKQDYLAVSNIHSIYYEDLGNPEAEFPILLLHGGPGGNISSYHKKNFDLSKQRIILFDQRGCGKSTPFGELNENTTRDLISDMVQLLDHLEIKKVSLYGGSWGSTLALLFAINFPNRVHKMLMSGIYLAREEDMSYFHYSAKQQFPDVWRRFMDNVPEEMKDDYKQIIGFYQYKFDDPDVLIAQKYAYEWVNYEGSLLKLDYQERDNPEYGDSFDMSLMASAKIECHYFANNCFMSDNFILKNAHKLSHIPIRIVHGRFDLLCPADAAYQLSEAIGDNCKLQLVLAGHHKADPVLREALNSHTSSFL